MDQTRASLVFGLSLDRCCCTRHQLRRRLEYDSDVGWWLVTAYSFPALALASPVFTLAANDNLGATYSLLFLAVLTVTSAVLLRRSGQPANGS